MLCRRRNVSSRTRIAFHPGSGVRSCCDVMVGGFLMVFMKRRGYSKRYACADLVFKGATKSISARLFAARLSCGFTSYRFATSCRQASAVSQPSSILPSKHLASSAAESGGRRAAYMVRRFRGVAVVDCLCGMNVDGTHTRNRSDSLSTRNRPPWPRQLSLAPSGDSWQLHGPARQNHDAQANAFQVTSQPVGMRFMAFASMQTVGGTRREPSLLRYRLRQGPQTRGEVSPSRLSIPETALCKAVIPETRSELRRRSGSV